MSLRRQLTRVVLQSETYFAWLGACRCAAELGYFDDPFLKYFVAKRARRSPLINRGYYARVAAFDRLIRDFLANGIQDDLPNIVVEALRNEKTGVKGATRLKKKPRPSPSSQGIAPAENTSKSPSGGTSSSGEAEIITRQIVSFGGGFDTTFFKLRASGQRGFRYIEVDFPGVVKRKTKLIRASSELSNLVGLPAEKVAEEDRAQAGAGKDTSPALHGAFYHVVTGDLRDTKALDAAMASCGADFKLPTLFLSECVLIYMPPEHSTRAVQWARSRAQSAGGRARFLCYEQVRPNDPFGAVMVRNLQRRGCALLGLHRYPTLESQIKRFEEEAGWTRALSWDMNTVYTRVLDRKDVARVARVELFDEFEEWHLFGAHYCITMATYLPNNAKSGAGAPSKGQESKDDGAGTGSGRSDKTS